MQACEPRSFSMCTNVGTCRQEKGEVVRRGNAESSQHAAPRMLRMHVGGHETVQTRNETVRRRRELVVGQRRREANEEQQENADAREQFSIIRPLVCF